MRRFGLFLAFLLSGAGSIFAAELHLNDRNYLETQGLSVLVYENKFHDVFRDQKLGGVEIILHGERIATDGEVRLRRNRASGSRFILISRFRRNWRERLDSISIFCLRRISARHINLTAPPASSRGIPLAR